MADYNSPDEFFSSGITPITDCTTLPEDERFCIICFEDYTTATNWTVVELHALRNQGVEVEGAVRINVCGHVFGDDCLHQHINGRAAYSRLCPKCRTDLFQRPQGRTTDADILELYLAYRNDLNNLRAEIEIARSAREALLHRIATDPSQCLPAILEYRKIEARLVQNAKRFLEQFFALGAFLRGQLNA